jgi:hypothetical protein
MEIIWQDAYKPENTTVRVRNELLMPGVELERLRARLCRPASGRHGTRTVRMSVSRTRPTLTYDSVPSSGGRPSADH